MNRRSVRAAALAAAIVAVVGAGAWILAQDEGEAEETVAPKAAESRETSSPALAARRPDAPIPFAPSRADAPSSDAGPRMAHKTPSPPPLPHAPLRSVLAALLQQAGANPPSAEAAMGAYDILTICRRLAVNPLPAPNPEAPDCTGIAEADWKDAPRLLKLAAELGNERAQLTYSQRLVGLGREPDELASTREELAEAHQKSRQYLNSLAERGNVDAMWFLGESLRMGETSERNPMMAYAYKYAVARAGGYQYTIDSELARLEAQLSEQDQARARQFADSLIARCCTRR
jgi:TPR repeat protein